MSGQHTVRVRTDRASWSSPPLADEPAARQHAEVVSAAAFACGDTWRFFPFESVAGLVQVRGREVVAVEVRPWMDQPPTSRASTAAAGVTINYHGDVDGSGTDFLRHMAGLTGGTR